jgi:glycosyltransferase involved in cell wall biosynthesis
MEQFDLASVGIVVPAFNAEETLPSLLSRIVLIVPPSRVIVVNDGSTDSTRDIAARFCVTVVDHEINQGKGRALQSGFDAALMNSSIASVITLDADLQHKPEDIPAFIESGCKLQSDIVLGWRKRIHTGMPIQRILSNSITSSLVGLRTGRVILDSQCGYRLIARPVIETIRLEASGFEAETEFLIKSAKRGFSIGFVPIETIYNGEASHMRHMQTTLNFVHVLFRDY